MNCLECAGKGHRFTYLQARWIRVDCMICGGTGSVTEEQAGRMARGRAMREDRVDRGLSLREEAKRLGILPVQLGMIEKGIISQPCRR